MDSDKDLGTILAELHKRGESHEKMKEVFEQLGGGRIISGESVEQVRSEGEANGNRPFLKESSSKEPPLPRQERSPYPYDLMPRRSDDYSYMPGFKQFDDDVARLASDYSRDALQDRLNLLGSKKTKYRVLLERAIDKLNTKESKPGIFR